MKINVELSEEDIAQKCKMVALNEVKAQVEKAFDTGYDWKGDGYERVRQEVSDHIAKMDLRPIIERVVEQRAEVIVRERVDKMLAKALDAELKKRETMAKQGGLAL